MLWNIAVIHLLGMMSPGPDFFYITRTAALRGRRQAVAAAVGIVAGVMFWAASTMLGLVLLFRAFPAVETALVCAGGAYLVYLGWQMLKVRENAAFHAEESAAPAPEADVRAEMKKGLLVNLSNPKVAVYFSSVMSAVLAQVSEWWQAAGVLLLLFAETLLYFTALATVFSGAAVKRFYSRYSRFLDNASGLLFAGFGIYLIARALAWI
ncbi:LysE family transporter [Bergeriella denitrificans]|uniref:Threonine efflux protein n=1 Tax=Bergeriella denitrificans TaxID=494 RepID=A0A378UF91_BERDE|nr:LysE family transporter [Bergeriella denitrificans]STZ75965.1 Threonine efflux protein [Bergeriella denitrificans]